MASSTPQHPTTEEQPGWIPGGAADPQAEPVFTALVDDVVTDETVLDA